MGYKEAALVLTLRSDQKPCSAIFGDCTVFRCLRGYASEKIHGRRSAARAPKRHGRSLPDLPNASKCPSPKYGTGSH